MEQKFDSINSMRSIFLRGISMALFLSLAFPFLASAQLTDDRTLEDVYRTRKQAVDTGKRWSDGPLVKEDFRVAEEWETDPSAVYIKWKEERRKVRINNVRCSYTDVYALLKREYSYLNPECNLPIELKLNQGIFNINEKYARMYRDTLLTGLEDKKTVLKALGSRCDDDVEAWRILFASNPDAPLPSVGLSENVTLPSFVPKNDFSMSMGYTGMVPLGWLRKYASYVDYPTFIFEYRYCRHRIGFEVDISSSITQKRSAVGKEVSYADNYAQKLYYGYDLIKSGRWFAGVFAGGGYGKLSVWKISKYGDVIKMGIFEHPVMMEGFYAGYSFSNFLSLDSRIPNFTSLSAFARVSADQMIDGRVYVMGVSATVGLRISAFFLKR
ncbi:MAG: hypothetical protein IJT26_03840 [Bacteroidales bacterium]|nr:hypothetical protein [Bacteroidales bacterium]